MIKAVIFDFVGVLTEAGSTLKILKKYEHKLRAKAEDVMTSVMNSQAMIDANRGKISADEMIEAFAAIQGADLETAKAMNKEMEETLHLNSAVMDIAKRLKKKYKVAILSDHIRGIFEKHVERFKLNKYFDEIMFSADVGSMKMDGHIFGIMLDKLGLKAEECVFIDDRIINIEMARSLGFKVIHFVEGVDLGKELKARGVDLSDS